MPKEPNEYKRILGDRKKEAHNRLVSLCVAKGRPWVLKKLKVSSPLLSMMLNDPERVSLKSADKIFCL